METNPHVEIRYLDDNRIVYGQAEWLSQYVDAGEALPTEKYAAVYHAWARARGKVVPEVPSEPEEDVEEPKAQHESAGDEGNDESAQEKETESAGQEKEAAEKEEGQPEPEEETQDIGVPLGYEVRQYGKWYVVYDPDDGKVGKGQDTYADAVKLARDHAGL